MTLWVLREIIVELSRTEFEPNCSQNNLCSFNVSMKNMFQNCQNCQNEYVISNPKGIFDCSAKKITTTQISHVFFSSGRASSQKPPKIRLCKPQTTKKNDSASA